MVSDEGSQSEVQIQGVPATGTIVDSGADITIIGAELFKKVASVTRRISRNQTRYLRTTTRSLSLLMGA